MENNKSSCEENKKFILFLHGYTQNSLVIQKRLKVLTKAFNQNLPGLEFIFPDAPFTLENISHENTNLEEIKRGWLYLNEEDKMKSDNFQTEKELHYLGLEKSLEEIINITKDKQVECIFGFSQGALIAIFLAILICKGEFKKYFPHLKCIVLVSGFFYPFPKNDELKFYLDTLKQLHENESSNGNEYEELKIDIPILNVYGEGDEFIHPIKSQKMSRIFKHVKEHPHKGKHFIPTSKEDIPVFIEFIKKYVL
jgi:predicted esterase